MNPADAQPPRPGLPLRSRNDLGWLAAGVLFLVLGFVINAAVVTAWVDLTWTWAYLLHQDPDVPVSMSLGVLALSPFLAPMFPSYLGVLAGAVRRSWSESWEGCRFGRSFLSFRCALLTSGGSINFS